MHVRLPQLLRGACTALLLAVSLPGSAASPAQLFDAVVTERFVKRDQCDPGARLEARLIRRLNAILASPTQPELSREQVREIATRYDAILANLCRAVTALHAAGEGPARSYERLKAPTRFDTDWDQFLANESATRWGAIAADFRTELIALGSALNLQLALHRDALHARQRIDPESAGSRQLLKEINKMSLTRKEADTRFLLASLGDDPAVREMLPPRFDVASMMRIEAKTRQLGVKLMADYWVDFEGVYDDRTRTLLARERKTTPQEEAAFRRAMEQLDALALQYRRHR